MHPFIETINQHQPQPYKGGYTSLNKFNVANNPSIYLYGMHIPENAIYGYDNKIGIWVCTTQRVNKDGYYPVKIFSNKCIIAYQKEREENAPRDGKRHQHIQRYKYLLNCWKDGRVGRKSSIGKGITNILTKYKPDKPIPHTRAKLSKNNRAGFQDTRPKHDYTSPMPQGVNAGKRFTSYKPDTSIWKNETA